MKKLIFVIAACGMAGAAWAKLPALSAEAKAKADEAKAKTAWNDKVSAYKLCMVQDRVAASHLKAKGDASKVIATPSCQDPGPFVAPAPVAVAAAPAVTQTASAAPAAAAAPVAAADKK